MKNYLYYSIFILYLFYIYSIFILYFHILCEKSCINTVLWPVFKMSRVPISVINKYVYQKGPSRLRLKLQHHGQCPFIAWG